MEWSMTTARTEGKRSTRPKRPRYESVIELPPLTPEQYEALRGSIAVNGVLVPILVDGDGPVRSIIDGNNRKCIADELGYDCPEIVREGLTEEEKRLLARYLKLARRHLTQDQRRQIIADQLHETPHRANNWNAKQLGCHHATVASVRSQMEATCQIDKFGRTLGADGKYRPATTTRLDRNGDGQVANGTDSPDTHLRVRYNPKQPPRSSARRKSSGHASKPRP
jgi:hypothetical protein